MRIHIPQPPLPIITSAVAPCARRAPYAPENLWTRSITVLLALTPLGPWGRGVRCAG
jgi:hypothetical protein